MLSILAQLIDNDEQWVTEREDCGDATPRELLAGYFDFHYRHRADLPLVVAELTTLPDLGLIDRLLACRELLVRLVFGPSPTLTQSARGVIAFGGLAAMGLRQ